VVGAEEADGAAAAEIRRHAPPPPTQFKIIPQFAIFLSFLLKNIYRLVVLSIMCLIEPVFIICAILLYLLGYFNFMPPSDPYRGSVPYPTAIVTFERYRNGTECLY
jgi:hypothetical protein